MSMKWTPDGITWFCRALEERMMHAIQNNRAIDIEHHAELVDAVDSLGRNIKIPSGTTSITITIYEEQDTCRCASCREEN